jgi:hypothetical protein
LYEAKTKKHVGKVDESGNVEMKTEELEEELYSGEGSDEDEDGTVYVTDTDSDEE